MVRIFGSPSPWHVLHCIAFSVRLDEAICHKGILLKFLSYQKANQDMKICSTPQAQGEKFKNRSIYKKLRPQKWFPRKKKHFHSHLKGERKSNKTWRKGHTIILLLENAWRVHRPQLFPTFLLWCSFLLNACASSTNLESNMDYRALVEEKGNSAVVQTTKHKVLQATGWIIKNFDCASRLQYDTKWYKSQSTATKFTF